MSLSLRRRLRLAAAVITFSIFVVWLSLLDVFGGNVMDVLTPAPSAGPAEPHTAPNASLGATPSAATAAQPRDKYWRPGAVFGADLSNRYGTGPPASPRSLGDSREYLPLSCPELVKQHAAEHAAVLARVPLGQPPAFKMPWYYHDREALCGRFLLTHLLSSPASGGGVGSEPGPVFRVQPGERMRSVAAAALRAGAITAEEARAASESDSGIIVATAHAEADAAHITSCGGRLDSGDVWITARLVGESSIVAAEVLSLDAAPSKEGADAQHATTPPLRAPESRCSGPSGCIARFTAHEPGYYALEVKMVHINGSSDDPLAPRSLGVVGIRASDHNRKSFKYNAVCDSQRHVYGSPMRVRVVAHTRTASALPLCAEGNHTEGRWVPFSPTMCATNENQYCRGDPSWLSDACGYNFNMLWAPTACKFHYYTPPQGPARSCLRRNGRGFLLLIGDSVVREYGMNCHLFNLRDANLLCLFNNIALEGQHFSADYAKSVVRVIVESVKLNRASIFATNLGIHHMIGPCTTAQWIEFVDAFVQEWRRSNASFYVPGVTDPRSPWQLEVAVWLGPPTIQYARKGMGAQRAALWDELAWARLAPLGFRRLYAIAPTRARQEATWDGLHYASEKGKVQSSWRNRDAKVLRWNGGVANTLFTVLLNMICNRPELQSDASLP